MMYIAYRVRDMSDVYHSGYREYIDRSSAPYYRDGCIENRSLVEKLVTELNREA